MERAPARAPRLLLLACGALLASCGGGCKKTVTAPPVQALRPADEARERLLARVTLAPPERTLGKIDALARKLQLPFSGGDVTRMIGAQNGLSPELLADVDLGRPIGIAMVGGAAQEPPLQAVALTARSAEAAGRLVAGLGTAEETRDGAQRLRRPDGAVVWVATRATAVVGSASLDGLRAAGALALEAQRETTDDVVATIYPDALARWQGTDVKTALARFRAEALEQQQTRGPAPGRGEQIAIEASLDAILLPLAETTSLDLGFLADPDRGLRLGARLAPRPGSAFAARVRATAPYVLDPALLAAGGGNPVAVLWANGPSPALTGIYDALIAALAQGEVAGAAEVEKHWKALRGHLTGATSGVVRARRGALTYDVVLPLARPDAGPAALEAAGGLLASRGFADLLGALYGRQAPAVRSRRDGNAWRAELAYPDRAGEVGAAVKAFFGSATVTALVTSAGGRLLVATEPDARGRLATLASAGAAAAAPEASIGAALAETRGADGFAYIDLWALLRPALGALGGQGGEAQMLGMLSLLPGLNQLRLPLVASYRGGDALDADLRIPLATLTSAATVLRPLLGLPGGPAGP